MWRRLWQPTEIVDYCPDQVLKLPGAVALQLMTVVRVPRPAPAVSCKGLVTKLNLIFFSNSLYSDFYSVDASGGTIKKTLARSIIVHRFANYRKRTQIGPLDHKFNN